MFDLTFRSLMQFQPNIKRRRINQANLDIFSIHEIGLFPSFYRWRSSCGLPYLIWSETDVFCEFAFDVGMSVGENVDVVVELIDETSELGFNGTGPR